MDRRHDLSRDKQTGDSGITSYCGPPAQNSSGALPVGEILYKVSPLSVVLFHLSMHRPFSAVGPTSSSMIIQKCSQPWFKSWDKANNFFSFPFPSFPLAAMRLNQIQLAVSFQRGHGRTIDLKSNFCNNLA